MYCTIYDIHACIQFLSYLLTLFYQSYAIPGPYSTRQLVALQHLDPSTLSLPKSIPTALHTLIAIQHINSPNRAHTTYTTTSTDSNNNSALYTILTGFYTSQISLNPTLTLLKIGLYLIEAALPYGSLDKSEDKWGKKRFIDAWREYVITANDATMLMSCLLILEYSIKQQWYKPSMMKLFTYLPCRSYAMRYATIGKH